MKILVVGDFHGNFPDKFKKIVRKEKIDLILSNGDYLPFHFRDLWFKHCYDADVELWDVIGKKRYKKLIEKEFKDGEKALKKLNSLGIPILTVLGNMDYGLFDDGRDIKKPKGKDYWEFDWKRPERFIELLKKYKNIRRIDYSSYCFGKFVFIGGRGHSNRGFVKSKGYKKHRAILEKLFKKYRKEGKKGKIIFLTHNVPYNTKLDLISKKAHPLVAGKHLGSKMFRRIINKFQPLVHIGGHIHEARGKDKLGKSVLINPGAVHEGKAVILEVVEKQGKGKIKKVKFIK